MINHLVPVVPWLKEWQSLVGSMLGPFLAVTFSLAGYLIKKRLDRLKERQEVFTRIIVSTAQSIDSLCRLRKMLSDYAAHIRALAMGIQSEPVESMIRMDTPGLPPTDTIYNDSDLPLLSVKTGSFYLHNRLIILHNNAGIMRHNMATIKHDLEKTVKMNNDLIAMARGGTGITPRYQRLQYARNLNSYAASIENLLVYSIKPQILQLDQIDVYAAMTRGKWGNLKRWRIEGTRWKYFRNWQAKERFGSSVEMLDRIDGLIKDKVGSEITRLNARAVGSVGMVFS